MLNNIAGVLAPQIPTPTGDYESIYSTTVGSGGSPSVLFNSIPSTFKHLQLRLSTTTAASGKVIVLRLNTDSGSNYTWHYLNGMGSNPATAGSAIGNSYARIFGQNIGTNTTNPSVSVVDVLDYTSTNKYKTIRALSGSDNNGSGEVSLESSLWLNTAAINSIEVRLTDGSNMSQNSKFALYGIKG